MSLDIKKSGTPSPCIIITLTMTSPLLDTSRCAALALRPFLVPSASVSQLDPLHTEQNPETKGRGGAAGASISH